jgi:hypothetical protein
MQGLPYLSKSTAPCRLLHGDPHCMLYIGGLETGLVDNSPITVAQARTVYLTTVRPRVYRTSNVLAVPLCCRPGFAIAHRSKA